MGSFFISDLGWQAMIPLLDAYKLVCLRQLCSATLIIASGLLMGITCSTLKLNFAI
jgi:hypothetical protein